MKVGFVILHYLTDEDTIECVNHIEKMYGASDAEIVIVDNFSNNGSIERVSEAVKKYPNCSIIYNSQNLGFAQGNNIGYKYIKKKYPEAFIIVLNNDTVIKQEEFIEKILNSYKKNSFYVLGPDIISLTDGGHQNPMNNGVISERENNRAIFRYRLLLLLSKLRIYDFIKRIYKNTDDNEKINTSKGKYEVIHKKALHGSCLVFSPLFVQKNKYPFNPGTFLYMEEIFLALLCRNNNYKMVYDPDIQIYHKEDSSTNKSVSSLKEKREFQFANLIHSRVVYKKALKSSKKRGKIRNE